MPLLTLARTRARMLAVALTFTLGATLLACGPNPSPAATGSGGSAPTGSGSAACPTAASVPNDIAGWGPPATPPTITPTLIASPGQLVCGPNRLLFTFVDEAGRPVGAPDRTASLAIYDLGSNPTSPIATVQGTFVWAIENRTGIYVSNVSFPEAGRYGAEFVTKAASADPET